MKRLENWCLSGSEIRLVAFPYMFSPYLPFLRMFPYVSSIVSQVSLVISHLPTRVSPYFLF